MRLQARDIVTFGHLRPLKELVGKPLAISSFTNLQSCFASRRWFAIVKDLDVTEQQIWFTSSVPRMSLPGDGDHKPPDERTLQLGRTVRELHERLPTLLQSPLPSDILSPQITLHLFPSTHPHLPTVSGRIAYAAALWTAPVAWGRVPLIGNVKLTILSERMVRNGVHAGLNCKQEKLIVRWKTRGKGGHRDTSGGVYRDELISARDPEDKIRDFLREARTLQTSDDDVSKKDFCGIFIFEFDDTGRISKHIIEHTEQGGYEDKMTKFVNVTDWLLGKFNGVTKGEELPALAYCERVTTSEQIRRYRRG